VFSATLALNSARGTVAALLLCRSLRELFHKTAQARLRTAAMKRKVGDVSRKRRLRGDSRAQWYAVHRMARFSRRLMTTSWF